MTPGLSPLRNLRCGDRLSRFEWLGLALLALVPVAFGVYVEIRGAFLQWRRTDLAVFARAAWAARSGADLYSITDEKGLHYHYPPLLAILLSPMADPPPGVALEYAVPFFITVGAWYILSVLAAFAGVHCLAAALTETSPSLANILGPPFSRGWWTLRLVPLLVCLAYLGHALVIGQVNVFWMAIICWMAADLLRGRRFRAGVWLACAVSIKVIPAFLLIYPVWRRDGRCLAGTLAGLLLGLAIVPALFFGPMRAWQTTHRWADALLLPALGLSADGTRDQELLGVWSTHNQAFAHIFHKTLHVRSNPRPEQISRTTELAGLIAGGLLTLVTLWAAGWKPAKNGASDVLLLGALNVNMLSLTPGGHPHYLLLLVPLITALMASSWANGAPFMVSRFWRAILAYAVIAAALPLIVQNDGICYDLGLPMSSALCFWASACAQMRAYRLGASRDAVMTDRTPSLDKQAAAA